MDIPKTTTILLVEDDDGDARAVERALSKSKIANPLIRAVDGLDAWEILQGTHAEKSITKPFLLLVDYNMPRMNGLELIEKIRNDDDLRRSIVFMLTTSKREEDRLSAYNLNVAGYIVKETAGRDFLKLTELIDIYWRIVEFP